MRDIELSTSDLAAILGISTRHIRNLAGRGFDKRTTQGRYLLIESMHLYTARLREAVEGRGGEAGA